MKKNRTGAAFLIAVSLLFGSLLPVERALAAEKITVSEKEYDLVVKDVPEGVESKIYAKLHDKSLNAEEYLLSLFDGYDAMIKMENALEAQGEDISKLDYLAMDVTLYQKDEEGDYYPVEDRCGITLICPVPEEYFEEAEELQITAVNTSGKLERIPSSLVSVKGVTCIKFDLSKAKVYAFLVKQGGKLTSGVMPTPTPVPEKTPAPANPAGNKADVTTPAPEKTPTPANPAGNKADVTTPAPEKTPAPANPAGDKADATASAPEKPKESSDEAAPTAASKPLAQSSAAGSSGSKTASSNTNSNENKAASSTAGSNKTTSEIANSKNNTASNTTGSENKAAASAANSTSGKAVAAANPTKAPQSAKDKTPQTGDDFNQGEYLALLGAGAAAFAGLLFLYNKKK